MQIVVKGTKVEYFTPDEVRLNINFYLKRTSYEESLKDGVTSINEFIEKILLPNNFVPNDLKTRNYIIREEKKYDERKKTYISDGYSYTQTAQLKFDYDKAIMAKIMEDISKLTNKPNTVINFGLKDEESCKDSLLKSAYKDAEKKAKAIAKAAEKTLKYCEKVDFEPITNTYLSDSTFEGNAMFRECSSTSIQQELINTFTPEDVELEQDLHCIWIAE